MLSSAFAALLAPPAVYFCVLAYALGSIPFGLVLALLVAKKDVRLSGSGNIGATNVARVVGKKLGLLTLALDALKGAIPVWCVGHAVTLTASQQEHRLFIMGAVGTCALVGHCFSLFLKGKGGKGVATALGVLLVQRPELAGIGLLAFAVAFLASRLVSLGSMVAALAVVIALLVLGPRDVSLLPFALSAGIVLFKHKANFQRVLNKQELKL